MLSGRRPVTRTIVAVGLSAFLVQPGAGQQAKRVRGYVVELFSPTQFLLDDHGIVEDRTYRVSVSDVPDLAGVVRIGADLEIEGHLDSSTDELRATAVKRRPPPEDHSPEAATISIEAPIEPGEKKLREWLRVEVKEPDFDRRRSGRLIIRNRPDYQIIANADVQQYVAEVGRRLVPAYQRDLPDADPAKTPFRFFVVRKEQAGATAVASFILVHSRTFEILKNEAQIASVLAHEIAHITQRHVWRLDQMPPSSVRVRFARSYENQADRLGLEYMASAGYDPRETARTWKLLARKVGFTPLRGTHDSHPARRAFIMGELEAHYGHTDYSNLGTEETRYTKIAALVKEF